MKDLCIIILQILVCITCGTYVSFYFFFFFSIWQLIQDICLAQKSCSQCLIEGLLPWGQQNAVYLSFFFWNSDLEIKPSPCRWHRHMIKCEENKGKGKEAELCFVLSLWLLELSASMRNLVMESQAEIGTENFQFIQFQIVWVLSVVLFNFFLCLVCWFLFFVFLIYIYSYSKGRRDVGITFFRDT